MFFSISLQCPRCKSTALYRSRKRVWEVGLTWLLRPYRCRQCTKRFYVPSILAVGGDN